MDEGFGVRKHRLGSGIVRMFTHQRMMETHDNFFFGNVHFFQVLINFNIGIIFLKPDFLILDIEMKNTMMYPLLSVLANV
jgi:hypothetical protein